MKYLVSLCLIFCLLWSSTVIAQYEFLENPQDIIVECQNSSGNTNSNDVILNYLSTLVAMEMNCPTNANISWDYDMTADFICGDIIDIEILVEDDCETYPDEYYAIQVFIEDNVTPTFDSMPLDLILSCGADENDDLIETWLENVGGASYTDACASHDVLIVENDFTGLYVGCANSPFDVSFTISDACGNSISAIASIIIIDIDPPIIFDIDRTPIPQECVYSELVANGFTSSINQVISSATVEDVNNCTSVDQLIWSVTPDPSLFSGIADIPAINCPGGRVAGTYLFDIFVEDNCGNTSEVETIQIEILDTTVPLLPIDLPRDTLYRCLEDVELPQALQANDACEASPTIFIETFINEECPVEIERLWYFEDYCGNYAEEHIQQILISDSISPKWIGDVDLFLPKDITVFIEDCDNTYFFPNGYFESELTGEAWPTFPLEEGVHFEGSCQETKFLMIGPPPSEGFQLGQTKISYLISDACDIITQYDFTVSVICSDCYSNESIATESCMTKPNWHYCDITDMFGLQACTPPDTSQVEIWPNDMGICNGEGESNNLAWFSFVAPSEIICLEILTLSCQTESEGLMSGVYDFCEDDDGRCVSGDTSCDGDKLIINMADVVIGNVYYLCVGGCDGAECAFEINLCEGFELEIDLESFLINEICNEKVVKFNYYVDANKNEIQDSNEGSIEVNEPFVELSDSSSLRFYTNGQEAFVVTPGNYGLTFINENYTVLNLQDSIYISNDDELLIIDVALCVEEDTIDNDVAIHIAALQLERCNRSIPFRIKVTNTGSSPISDTLTLNFDSLISSRFIDYPPVVDIPGTLKWIIDLPNPQQSQTILANLKMPSASHTGELFCLYPKFSNSENEFTDHCFELRCPFDPNDKHGQPHRGGINPILNEEKLLYTIRFENLGNDTAFNIRIEDILSDNLDVSTLRYIQSSHVIDRYYISNESVLKFYFDDINLVSIAQDSFLNKGFVQFEISPISGLPTNTEIFNRGSIFFDDNAFINTNMTTHTIVEYLPDNFVDVDGDGFTADVDCDDNDFNINPNGTEYCDDEDNDCNGVIDDNVVIDLPELLVSSSSTNHIEFYWDILPMAVEYKVSFSINGGANLTYQGLNDNYFTITELSPGDEVLFSLTIYTMGQCEDIYLEILAYTLVAVDFDEDGYDSVLDCDDNNPNVFPGAEEICDNVDNNCDGEIDENLIFNIYYADADNDGYGNSDSTIMDCLEPSGYVLNNDDCDDSDANINPNAFDIPNNGIDEDCNGEDLITSLLSLANENVLIYPNPFTSELNIKVNNSGNFKKILISVDGKVKIDLEENNTLMKLDRGFYYIKIVDSDGFVGLYPVVKF